MGRLINMIKKTNILFLDVDGVILDFDEILLSRLSDDGIKTPTKEEMNERPQDFFSAAFPHLLSPEEEKKYVNDVFKNGDLKRQRLYKHINSEKLADLLRKENVYILTKIPHEYVHDRIECFKKILGIDLTDKILTVWGKERKGDKLKSFCKENNISVESAILFDDREDNVESSLTVGAKGILIEKSYNVAHINRLRNLYDTQFDSIPHLDLIYFVEWLSSMDNSKKSKISQAIKEGKVSVSFD